MRIAFVKSHRPISWQSCVHISKNLDVAYNLLDPHRLIVTSSKDEKINKKIAAQVRKFRPDTIVFSSYVAYSLGGLVEALAAEFAGNSMKPSLCFHLFGNFSIEPNAWMRLHPLMKQFRCLFLCASERQSSLVRSFMHPWSDQAVETCPFPIDTKRFYFDPQVRQKARERMQWKDDFIIFYCGRITQQKNVIPMLQELCTHFLGKEKKARFVLAGDFDSIGNPLFKNGERRDHFYRLDYLNFFQSLPLQLQKRIQFLGHRSQEELFSLYNGADLFASWSTYHDEDFGMAPAEALATGLPSLLTDWGGFADFAGKCCRLTPVSITNSGIKIEKKVFRKDLQYVFENKHTFHKSRREFAKEFANTYSPEAIVRRLQAIHKKPIAPFLGFSQKIGKHAKLFKRDFHGPIYSQASSKDPHYFSNYAHYTGQS